MTDTAYDVVVIGAGPAGENAAGVAASGGLKVAIVESELVGGECSYWACMPSKSLLRPGEALEAARRAPGAAGAVTGEIDVAAALERRDAMVSHWDDAGQMKWLDEAGVTLIRGHGRLDGPRRVTVTSAKGTVTAHDVTRAVVLATGTAAEWPELDGLDATGAWDSRGVTSAAEVPARLAIIGGGVVGVEMAQAWAWLGSEVTVLEKGDRLLNREEQFVGSEVRAGLERTGVTVLTNTSSERVRRASPEAPVIIRARNSTGSFELEVDQLVIAIGRRPQTSDLGLATVGLPEGEYLEVNDHFQVMGGDEGWLYAVGDVNGRALLTHVGKYQARIAGAHITGATSAAGGPDLSATPRVIFTSPEVGAVGLTEAAAREKGLDVASVTHDIGKVSGASVLGRGYKGTAKVVIDRQRRVIVGATFVGPKTGELLHSATIAVVGEVPLEKLWHAIPSFPTLSEVWLRLLEAYRDGPEAWDPYGRE